MAKQNDTANSSDQIREQIVAYLDGELDAASAERIEERMARDADFRERVHQLEQAWNCLEHLPRAEVDESFTQSTVEMIAITETTDARRSDARAARRSGRNWLGGGLAVAAAAVIGYLAVAISSPNPNDKLLQDLPVIQNVDVYLHAGDVEFLTRLQKEGLFEDDASESDSFW